MSNVVLTSKCNRRCKYCFALDTFDDENENYIKFGDLINIADKVSASNETSIGLLGGEPTLHPLFYEILLYVIERGIFVSVFTNGLCSDDLIDKIEGLIQRKGFKFIVNTNHPDIESKENSQRQHKFLKTFNTICDISVNIFDPDLDLDYVDEIMCSTDLHDRRIRLGIAQPIIGETNCFLPSESYPLVSERIVKLAEEVFKRNNIVSLDCGFPLCAFTDTQLGKLRRMNASLQFVCDLALDFAPGNQAWSCFPMSKLNKIDYDPYETLENIADRLRSYTKKLRKRQNFGLYNECADCIYRKNSVCAGGCLSYALNNSL
jgi:Radical SAM superfamily/4Fe-4S single cluster domain